MNNTHGPVRQLVEEALAAWQEEDDLHLDGFRSRADALDAQLAPQPQPDYNEVFNVPPISQKIVTLKVTNKGQGAPIWIDDTPAIPQPQPITQEALEAAGFTIVRPYHKWWRTPLRRDGEYVVVIIDDADLAGTYIMTSDGDSVEAFGITTMAQLRTLVELLTGKEMGNG